MARQTLQGGLYALPPCHRSGRARAKDRCGYCESCAPLVRAAFVSYVGRALDLELFLDEQVPIHRRQGAHRRLKFITVRAASPAFDGAKAAARAFVRGLKGRLGSELGRWVFVVSPSRQSEDGHWHAHFILEAGPKLEQVMLSDLRRSTTAISNDPGAIKVQLLRLEGESQIDVPGPLQREEEVPGSRAVARASIPHALYLAAQVPRSGVPTGSQWWGESREPAFHGFVDSLTGETWTGFGAYRDHWIERLRLHREEGRGRRFPLAGASQDEVQEYLDRTDIEARRRRYGREVNRLRLRRAALPTRRGR